MDKISKGGEQLSPLQKAAYALKEMRSKLDAMEHSQNEPIAIIGMSCRFPGANNPEEFWQLLHEGVDAVTEIPAERWSLETYYDPNPNSPGKINTRCGGFLSQVDQFDPRFFGISPREALKLDPQHRLLLEVAWEALENAGQAPKGLIGSQTSTYIGINQLDYGLWQLCGDPANLDVYGTTGFGHCFASGRLSYLLGLHGPNMAVDTACSSSLVALHLACQSLRTQESQMALVGGVQLILSPEFMISFTKTQSFSPSGRCKTFDAEADGFILGEGCGVVILKRLSDAVANRDNILALIRSSGVNHDGPSSALTVPNESAQEALVRQVLNRAKVTPAEVSYIETHGTATSLGDPIEVGALSAVFKDRPKDDPLILGAVKTNIGHLNAASGIAGLIKTIQALQHEEIPPNLHFKTPTPHIAWDTCPVKVSTSRILWPRGKKRRLAGVSAFGLTGTNAHLLLEEAPIKESIPGKNKSVQGELLIERPQHLLTLSAKCDTGLHELAQAYENYLNLPTAASLAEVCFTANAGRSHFNYRLAAVADSPVELQKQLNVFLQGTKISGLLRGELPARGHKPVKVAFLFTGDGSQYLGMGQQLYETQPTFRKTIDRCDEILRRIPHFKEGLFEENSELRGNFQPALFALEYALAELWQSWGIKPVAVMGHGVGEYVAAVVAGVFSLKEGIKLIAERAQLMQSFDGLSDDDKKSALDAFEQQANHKTFVAPRIAMMSSQTGQLLPSKTIPDANYWRRTVEKAEPLTVGLKTLIEKGYKYFLEISPNPILSEQSLLQSSDDIVCLSSLAKDKDDWSIMLNSLSRLYIGGADINWEGFDKDYLRQRTPLPTYPFQRQRYWLSKEDLQKTTLAQPNNSATDMARQTEMSLLPEKSRQKEMPVQQVATALAKEPQTQTNISKESSPSKPTNRVTAPNQTMGTPTGTSPALARIMAQQLHAASQAVSQVVSQQLEFLHERGIAVKTGDSSPKGKTKKSDVTIKNAPSKNETCDAVAGNIPSETKEKERGFNILEGKIPSQSLSPNWQLLMLSAKTGAELDVETTKLIEQLKERPDNLAEIAHTLRNRKAFNHRRMLVCQDANDAIKALETLDSKRVGTMSREPTNRPITFMFPGVGDHYVNMAQGLYQTETTFREHIDECCEKLLPHLGQDLREILYPNSEKSAEKVVDDTAQPRFDLKKMLKREPADENTQKLNQTIFSQPAVFVIEYALAKLWMSWGIKPQAMIGYSIGEYVAACIAGVISLEEVLLLLIKRAQMIQDLPAGAMLAVPLSEDDIRPKLGEELSIATISTPSQCVVAGPPNAINDLAKKLQEQQVLCRPLATSHAFHSKMMAPLRERLVELVSDFALKPPQIPYLSNVTGTWITDAQATSPHYWAQHTYQTVRFADGIGELLQTSDQIFLEIGPGQSLGSFVFQHPAFQNVPDSVMIQPSLRTMYDGQPDVAFLLNSLGKLWLGGKTIVFPKKESKL
jgi:acyl transferase domain-containing protein